MAYDPVLDRELFRPKSKGIEDVAPSEENEDLKSRREQALAMIEASKEKFDPKNFQTLTEQDRPQVFRPVAVNMPAQQQTVTTAQRMQQMAARGVRPVGMAHGGHVYHFANGGMKPTINSSGYTENLTSGEQDILAKEKAAEATMGLRTLGAGVEPTNLLTDEEIDNWYGKQIEQGNLSASELNDRALRARDKYYDDKAEQILNEITGIKDKTAASSRGTSDLPTKEAPTAFGRFFQGDPEKMAEIAAKDREEAKARIKRDLMVRDIGGDSIGNAFNIFTEESSKERAARQERQAREMANLEKYGTANPAPGFKDSLSDNIIDRRQWLYDPVTDVDDRKTIYGDIKTKYSPYLAEGRQARAEGVLAAGRAAYGDEAPLISDIEKSKNDQGIASLADMEKGVAAGRDAYGAEAPLAVDQEAKGLAALRDSVRMGDQPGAAADASRVAAGIGSAENKPAAAGPAAGGPATGGTNPAAGTDATGGLGSFKDQGKAIDTGSMTLEGIRADRKREREDNLNLAIIQAGLSIMGGKSSNALQNIGEGARAGVAQFATQESESKRLEREARRDLMEQQRALRQEQLSRDQMAMQERLSGAERESREKLAEAERLSREAMFGRTESRLDKALQIDFNKSDAALKIQQREADIKEKLANHQISNDEAVRLQKDAQLEKQLTFEKYKVDQGLAAPSDNMKLYTALGGGDMFKGLSIAQEASIKDTRVRAAQDVLNPMSGASEEEKQAALNYLVSVLKPTSAAASKGAIDKTNPLLGGGPR